MEFELFMALLHEHEQRTGHDVTREPGITEAEQLRFLTRKTNCNVCLWLSTLNNKLEEQRYDN